MIVSIGGMDMSKIKLILGALILLLVSLQVNAELLINGRFEEPTVFHLSLNYEHRR